ncbi:MAG: DUF4397 domain-containing protein [Chitinophagaceae bacterium]|nr:DUF4397 domain-containing protein [Chitinophagaceae bacterium]MCW5926961.1 DUF4397 domain-containing protein [Chitinophagaceae bacterium]
MKRIFSNYYLVAIFSVLLFSSCMKNESGPEIPVAGLMAFNLVPDKNAVTFTLSGNALTNSPLQYNSFTGAYLSIYTGNRSAATYDPYSGALMASGEAEFEQDKFYSLFAVGYDDTYRNVITTDDYNSLSGSNGKAYVRFINAVADSLTASLVTVSSGATEVINESAELGDVGDFVAVDPGDITVNIDGGENINANRTFSVEQRKVYTILLIGVPGNTDDLKKVQVRYVEMGMLSEDSGADAVSVVPAAAIQ